MQLFRSQQFECGTASPEITRLMADVDIESLRQWVGILAVPRNFSGEPAENKRVSRWIQDQFTSWGYEVKVTGACGNIIAVPPGIAGEIVILGAHFDSVPRSPGADDNASAVAAMMMCARVLAQSRIPVAFVAFNREEDGFLGSTEFVGEFLPVTGWQIRLAHILEMVGYASSAPGSQRVPSQLPIDLGDKGDFLGLLANDSSASVMSQVLRNARTCTPSLPVTGLKVPPGAELVFPVLARSDHVPFWKNKIPAMMWTDTAEFRNPNYHKPGDTPETLDYNFLKNVTQLLIATLAGEAREQT